MSLAYKIYDGFIGFVFPPVCVSCGTLIKNYKDFICGSCMRKLFSVNKTVFRSDKIDYFFSLYKFIENTVIRDIVHSLKYSKMKSIGIKFGKLIGENIINQIPLKADIVIPVPLHIAKERERTYNQSFYICKGISSVLGINTEVELLKRTRYTKSQTKLTVHQRKENVKDAFKFNKKFKDKIYGKNIVLVDDVVTTGATILECASVLKSASCGKIIGCSIARVAE